LGNSSQRFSELVGSVLLGSLTLTLSRCGGRGDSKYCSTAVGEGVLAPAAGKEQATLLMRDKKYSLLRRTKTRQQLSQVKRSLALAANKGQATSLPREKEYSLLRWAKEYLLLRRAKKYLSFRREKEYLLLRRAENRQPVSEGTRSLALPASYGQATP